MNYSRQQPADEDLMVSKRLLEDLSGEPWASAALNEMFVIHGRRPFRPRVDNLHAALWSERGARQKFARAISVLHAMGYLRWLPGDRYQIVTENLLTRAEYRDRQSRGAR